MLDRTFLSPFPSFSFSLSPFIENWKKKTPIPSTVIFFVGTGVVCIKGETAIAKLQGNRKKIIAIPGSSSELIGNKIKQK